jgi:hypothetical protein
MSNGTEEPIPTTFEEKMALKRLQQDYQARAHRDVITGRLALTLVIVMAVTLCVHYVAVAYFATRGDTQAVDALHNVFGAWLPVISGLTSAAVTYYFTGGKSQS